MKDVLLVIKGVTYHATPWSKSMPNPGKFKFLCYRNGIFADVAKTKADFERKCHDGHFDAAVEVPGSVV